MTNDLYDSNFVGDIQSIIICSKSHVSFLLAIRTNQSVHLSNLNVIQFLNSKFDLWFTSSNINNENQCVVVLNLFHSRFCCQWVFNNCKLIQTSRCWSRLSWEHRSAWKFQCLWSSEVHRCSDLTLPSCFRTFENILFCCLSFCRFSFCWSHFLFFILISNLIILEIIFPSPC